MRKLFIIILILMLACPAFAGTTCAPYFAIAQYFYCITKGFVQTYRNGVMKSNGQRIWCKMRNVNAGVCDEVYKYRGCK